MAEPTFTVIVPTTGRDTLRGAVASVIEQLCPGDELIVACNDHGDLGTRARSEAMHRALGTHLMFIDDDDEYLPDALEKARRFATEHPDRIGIFRLEQVDGTLYWQEPVFRKGNVASIMLVVPNVPGRLGTWYPSGDDFQGNDWIFAASTAALQGDPIYCEEVIGRQRPNGPFRSPLDRLRFRLRLGTRLRALKTRS